MNEGQSDRPRPGQVEALSMIEAAPQDRYDRITRLVRDVLSVPVCLVSLVDDSRQFFKSAVGLPEPWASRGETPLSHSFCKYVVANGEPLVVEDAATDPRFEGHMAVPELGVAAYLGVPIHADGIAVGALCAIDTSSRRWSALDQDRMRDFAAIIDSEIELRRIAYERDAARREAELLAHEHSHRVKNSLSVAASLISISARETASIDQLVRVARERIMALAAAQNLVWKDENGAELGSLLSAILQPYRLSDKDTVRLDGDTVPLPYEKVTPLSLIFHELATNASKYGGLSAAGGGLRLGWRAEPDRLSIRWCERLSGESGPAVPAAAGDGDGFGTQLVDLCVRQLSGEMAVGRTPDGGREVALDLPWRAAARAS